MAKKRVTPEESKVPLGRVTDEDVKRARETLETYRQGKGNLEDRIIQEEQWYKMQHWSAIKGGDDLANPKSTSAWLFNTIINKHADAMDNFPIPAVLPREKSDENTARILSNVLPVIMENNHFDDTYSDCWWDKLKFGTGVYGIFWNQEKDNGLGDIEITQLDLLNVFWESGITDIQESRNLFITKLWDKDILKEKYPKLKDVEGNAIDVKHYIYDDTVDTTDKIVVVDWYYKKNGLVHFAKFVNDTLLFASENEDKYKYTGWYEHGLYPVVFDIMYPEKGTPVGFGLIAAEKNPQLYIDALSSNILQSSMMGTKKRWLVREDNGINEEEFADWEKPFVHVRGALDDDHIKEFNVTPISPVYMDVMRDKINEMKETSGNRDMTQGGTAAGITAAAAIAALQEAGNKTSRDNIGSSYRKYNDITSMIVELMRQHYDNSRTFRITGEDNSYSYVEMSNAPLQDQLTAVLPDGTQLFRKPIFDYKMKAMKRNPFSRMEENERAKELYGLGFFDPQRAQEALIALDMMDFEGVETIKEKVAQGQTLMNQLNQANQQIEMLNMQMQQLGGVMNSMGLPAPPVNGQPQEQPQGEPPSLPNELAGNHKTMTDQLMASRVPQKPYAQKMMNKGAMELK